MTGKILHIINGDYYAGAERVQDLLAQQLPGLGYEVGFVCLKKGLFAEKRVARNAPLYEFPMRSRLDISFLFRLAGLARREGYTMVHTHSTRAALVGRLVAAVAGLPMVHHLHSPTTEDTETAWRNRRNSLAEKFALGRARMIIAVSSTLQTYLLDRGVAADRVRVVANGVPTRPDTRRARQPGEAMVVGMVALFRPRKGVEVLLHALAQLRRKGIDVRLHAVGPFETDAYREHVSRLSADLGVADLITWTGFTQDVFAELAKMHAFVLPSLYGEGMPMVILEAMSVGLPVVSTTVEGIPEVVRHGRDGLLVAPDDAGELAGAIGMLASGELDGEVLGESGRQRQSARFSDLSMARGVADIYDEVLAAK
jgi:glycosyltransferase involved in cell wall biosynthesis